MEKHMTLEIGGPDHGGKSVLLYDPNGNPDDASEMVVHVSGRNRAENARQLEKRVNAYPKLVEAVREWLFDPELRGADVNRESALELLRSLDETDA